MVIYKSETFRDEPARILQAVIEASPLAIVAFDCSGIVQVWNPGATAMFGWSPEDTLGQINPLVPEGQEAEFHSLLAAALQGAQHLGIELRRKRKDGRLQEVRLWTAPLQGKNGDISGVVAIYVDDSERKRAEQELSRAHAELEIRIQERTRELISTNAALKQEISERVKIEEALRASEEHFRLLIEGIKDYAILMLNPEGGSEQLEPGC